MHRRLTGLIIALSLLAGCSSDDDLGEIPQPATESGRAENFAVETVVTGLNRPTYVGVAPGDDNAIWVLEQPGRVVRVADGRRRTVLDLRKRVSLGAERGLLGIAFHPDFAENRRLYLHWTDPKGDTRVAEFRAGRDKRVDRHELRELLFLDQPEENHNGGQLAFGPDGRLYLGLGDGGGAFDPERRAQDPDQLFGKIVALDVDRPGSRWKPLVTGLRNPWRFSFDAGLGEIWIADVGQDKIEEVNRVQLEYDEPPKNLGWSAYEGTRKLNDDNGARDLKGDGELVWPVAAYTHEDGCSVTGGHVYAGAALPTLSGRYVYGDFCTGKLWSLKSRADGGAADVRRERAVVPQLTHIGVGATGELLFASATGAIYRAAPVGR